MELIEFKSVFKPGRKANISSIYSLTLEGSKVAKKRLISFFDGFVSLMSRASGKEFSTLSLLECELRAKEPDSVKFTRNFHMSVLKACGLKPRSKT